MIFTVTPNPALDLGGIVDNLKPNEKSYVHDETKSPGGNAINVARILTRLKVPVIASGFLGGSVGDEIKDLLTQEGVRHKFVKIQGHTRINVTVSNTADHQQTRLSFTGPRIEKTEKTRLLELLERQSSVSHLVIGGSLPLGYSITDIKMLLRLAQGRKINCVIDCPGSILKQLIQFQPLLIKPNLEEFHEVVGGQPESIEQIISKARSFLKWVPYICVSSVQGGTLLMTRTGNYFGRIPKIKLRSTVGAGDSMVGAMVGQLAMQNSDAGDLLRWGLAASAATLSNSGTSLGGANQILNFYKKTQVQQLKNFY